MGKAAHASRRRVMWMRRNGRLLNELFETHDAPDDWITPSRKTGKLVRITDEQAERLRRKEFRARKNHSR